MTALLSHAPRRANRLEGGQWQQVDVAAVRPGDRLMVRHAEVVPVDGALTMPAELDESALTGESAIRKCVAGESVKSGALNAGSALEMVAGARRRKVRLPASSAWSPPRRQSEVLQ